MVAVAACAAWFAGGASAAVRYAAPAGTGTACTHAAPCKLRTAIEAPAVRAGDEVVVMPGTHNVGGERILVDKAIRVHGQVGSPRPRVTSIASPMTLYVAHQGAVVSDLELVNRDATGDAVWLGHGVLQRVFAHAPRVGCGLSPFREDRVPLLRDSFCWASAPDTGFGLLWAIGGSDPYSFQARLRNVTAVGGDYGVYVAAGSGPMRLDLDAVNVIAQGQTEPDVVGSISEGGSVRAIFRNSNYDTRDIYNLGGGTATVTWPGAGSNQTEAPVFIDGPAGNFHQRRSSPTVDAGADTLLNGARDIDRQARVLGPAPDIGGDEVPPAP